MMFSRSDKGAKSLDRRWHEKARTAKETTFGLEDWSQREINRWNLDDPVREPTGKKNPRTWEYDKPLNEQNRGAGDDERRADARESVSIGDGVDDEVFE